MMLVLAAAGGLLLSSVTSAQKSDVAKLLDKHTFTEDKVSLPYRLLKPNGYVKDSKDCYPLLLFLHGIVGRGTDNTKQLRSGVEGFVKDATRKKHSCFLAVPQCPPDKLWLNVSPIQSRGNLQLAKSATEPAAMVLDLIDALCKEYRVDSERIYLTGVSMGGYGTRDLISRRPELFAAAVPVSGGGDPARAEKLAKLPIRASNGEKDPLVPVERPRDMIAAIKKAGGKPEYTEYKGVGHDAWTPTYKNDEVLDWLFKQKKGN